MDKLVLGFVGGDTNIDRAIKFFSDSEYYDITHSFGILFNSTLESTGCKEESDPYAGVWLHDPEKYINNSHARFIEIEIPNMKALEKDARKMLGSFYSIGSCIAYFLKKIANIDLPDFMRTCDCSELWTQLVRSGGRTVLRKYKQNQVSPLMLFKWSMQNGGKDVTPRYRKVVA
ncbi:MAG: hypothetical protein K0Q53_58 [Massilibacillus sp.]|jgi:hypothetical protein|nr:hypothetical protein [Massilibacillus sp.]